ncbi:hypothetical protein FF38_08897 [Lucilia cuprina]|uniref:Uncharacterized protein n=1 Tax=Lucilia cuprina TaxID=7375 RepID=A0A0L0BWU9_LUCCU|nr:hypothetical protein FF38_08897 [Lucilia cuprina]
MSERYFEFANKSMSLHPKSVSTTISGDISYPDVIVPVDSVSTLRDVICRPNNESIKISKDKVLLTENICCKFGMNTILIAIIWFALQRFTLPVRNNHPTIHPPICSSVRLFIMLYSSVCPPFPAMWLFPIEVLSFYPDKIIDQVVLQICVQKCSPSTTKKPFTKNTSAPRGLIIDGDRTLAYEIYQQRSFH